MQITGQQVLQTAGVTNANAAQQKDGGKIADDLNKGDMKALQPDTIQLSKDTPGGLGQTGSGGGHSCGHAGGSGGGEKPGGPEGQNGQQDPLLKEILAMLQKLAAQSGGGQQQPGQEQQQQQQPAGV